MIFSINYFKIFFKIIFNIFDKFYFDILKYLFVFFQKTFENVSLNLDVFMKSIL